MNGLPLPEETPEHKEAKAFGLSISPCPARNQDPEEWFRGIWNAAAAFGLFDLLIPHGQLEVDKTLSTLEGLGEGCENGGFLLALGAHCFGVGAPLAKFASDGQNDLLSSLRDGTLVAAFAATEPEAGSDVMSLATHYQVDGDHYVLSGTKCFVTNVAEADLFLILATKDTRLHSRGISAFLVPRDTEGLTIGTDEPRFALFGCSVGSLCLNHAVVPKSALLGRAGGGMAIFKHAMLWERSLIPAAQVGVMRRQLLYSLARAKNRHQFGRPIGSNQYVAGRIVDLLMRYTTCRLLTRDTAAKLGRGTLRMGEASLTKLYVSEAGLASGLDSFRVHGGSGLMEGSPAGADLRNSLAGIIYSGTSEMQKVIVASQLGLVD